LFEGNRVFCRRRELFGTRGTSSRLGRRFPALRPGRAAEPGVLGSREQSEDTSDSAPLGIPLAVTLCPPIPAGSPPPPPAIVSQSKASFQTFGLSKKLLRGIAEAGFTEPRPIQAKTIPRVLQGEDVLGLAQTGMGKTAAFALPICERLMQGRGRGTRALILAPTRELVLQIEAETRLLAKYTSIKTQTVFGGVGAQPQIKGLRQNPDIVIACPGRLLDLMGRGGFNAIALQGNMSQAQRVRAMEGFRKGHYKILVATDIAARGIDVARVSLVVNFDMPNTPDAYTHRIGRTGRAERTGEACTFVTSEDFAMVKEIEKRLGSKIPRV
ncbi:UNVERIFIED_CONTAM: hypothetical protein GTU68_036960, partial [Idotea baltica]|nr:hypothetical protein [Idotea baltica]